MPQNPLTLTANHSGGIRQASGMSQVNLAKALKSSQSRVAKMEAGDPTVSIDLLIKSILALGASNKDLATIIARR